jgi:hypothetical protein
MHKMHKKSPSNLVYKEICLYFAIVIWRLQNSTNNDKVN